MQLRNLRPFFLLFLSATASSSAKAVDDGGLTTRESGGPDGPLPDFEEIERQNAVIEQKLAQQKINGVRKMSDDAGEKFFLDYWIFGDDDLEGYHLGNVSVAPRGTLDDTQQSDVWSNASGPTQFRPAFPLHTDEQAELFHLAERYSGPARRALSMLMKRDFKCPTGTYSCTSINRPDSCCSNGDTCQLIQDTGLGSVGCCPQGETCSGGISSCGSGYTNCPSSLGGGCCIPGYECVSGGCAFVSTYTVTEYSTTRVVSSTVTTPALTSTSSSTTASTSTSITSSTQGSTSHSLTPPVRPTTESQTTITSTGGASVCPTGFYACSAVYHGGCCRTGRDCDTRSCPAMLSTTVINSDGVTVVAPVPTAPPASEGSCASGWFSCAASVGGGCCPSGFVCGSGCTASASGTAAATATVAKAEPGTGAGRRNQMDLYCLGACVLGALCFFL